jgi:para-nitrobenzyl esterase
MIDMDRRSLIAGGAAAAAISWSSATRAQEASLFPVVETAEGRLRGLVSGGINVFRGVRYAQSTAGRNRFMPPQRLKPWAGVRDALTFGNISPQVPADRRRDYADLIFNDFQPGGMGEDCLVLNLWTPSLDRQAKKPVLVRFHGGGFYGGSSNAPGSDGEQLSRFGDCVVITVNHRLSAFGYLYLAESGPFADSGAAGMVDLVECLRWINRNIESFGGDPRRVLIWGQSGGGAKVSHLLGMPGAVGLFSSAGVMSGSRLTAMSREDAKQASDQLLAKLGVRAGDVRRLQSLPWSAILGAQAELEAGQRARGEAPRSFSPVIGRAIPHDPFSPNAPPESASVPLVVSTVLDERTYRETNFAMTWDQVLTGLRARVGADAQQVLAAYRDEDPRATPYIVNARIITDTSFRTSARIMADRKAQQGAGPVWTYLWTAPSPAFGGRYGATHGVDVSYSMHELRMPLVGPIEANRRLADEIAAAWVAMAAKGDPNNPKTPNWPRYDLARRTTMAFGAERSGAVEDPRRRFVDIWANRGGAAGGGAD